MGVCATKSHSAKKQQSIFKKFASQNIKQFYRFGKVLGAGSYGTVRLAYHLLEELNGQTSKLFAVKTIHKESIGNQSTMIQRELEILTKLDHPNIIRFHETFSDSLFYHFVMEYCAGGEIYQRVIKKGVFNEQQTAIIMNRLFSAINYIHQQGIAHRDLKPENILLSNEESLDVKIIDFGLSGTYAKGKELRKQGAVGTPLYVAPEVINGNYSFECDNWSLGCIMYFLLCGSTPFYSTDKKMLAALISHSPVKFEEHQWEKVSDEAKDLISKLLQKDPKKRIKSFEALQNKWLIRFVPKLKDLGRRTSSFIAGGQGGLYTFKQLKIYAKASRFKKETLKILLNQMKESELKDLRMKFESLDEDGNGVISVDELKQVMQQMGYEPQKAEIENLLRNFGSSNDLHIKYSDFLAATLNCPKVLDNKKLRVLFKQFDVKNKGYIEVVDLRSNFEREGLYNQYNQYNIIGRDITESIIQDIINEIDVNKDGKIDFDEFLSMMQDGDSSFGNDYLDHQVEIELNNQNILVIKIQLQQYKVENIAYQTQKQSSSDGQYILIQCICQSRWNDNTITDQIQQQNTINDQIQYQGMRKIKQLFC